MTAPIDWADLTPAQVQTLIASPQPQNDPGLELLNFDLTVNRDLTSYLDASQGDVQWSGAAGDSIHRDCSITLSTRLPWGSALVRVYMVKTDLVTGLSARCNLGVFALTSPEEPLGETVLDEQGVEQSTFTVTGQDRLSLLDRELNRSYVIVPGTPVLAAFAQVITDAGLTGVQVDSTRSDAVTPPNWGTWPRIPSNDTSDTPLVLPDGTTIDDSGPATWLNIANDLMALIAYDGVWCDENGLFRASLYTDASARAAEASFDADAEDSTVAIDRKITRDVYDSPNAWTFINSAIDSSSTPVEGYGLYTPPVNQSDGPSSIDQRNGLIWSTEVTTSVADQTALVAFGDKQVAADKRGVTTLSFDTACFPAIGHRKVVSFSDRRLGDPSTVKALATSAVVHLNGDDTEWVTEVVS